MTQRNRLTLRQDDHRLTRKPSQTGRFWGLPVQARSAGKKDERESKPGVTGGAMPHLREERLGWKTEKQGGNRAWTEGQNEEVSDSSNGALQAAQAVRLPTLGMPLQIRLPAAFFKTLDGVTKHDSGHLPVIAFEKRLQDDAVTLADLAQHPATCLVNELLGVTKQHAADGEGIVKLALPDEMERGHDGDAPFPDVCRAGEAVQRGAVKAGEVSAGNVWRREVDQVPVVDSRGVRTVELVDRLATGLVHGVVLDDQQEKAE